MERIQEICSLLEQIEKILLEMKALALRANEQGCSVEEARALNAQLTILKSEIDFLADCIAEIEKGEVQEKFYQ
ncbi:hypothetical protein [Succinispira mobilis]|uniref:hypothetical protein n=1 Tax=Succinispira mobilis TaxID=78120 RepID=UPI00036D6680|nr:hypothetical protein [Succinispira mobilis]